MTVIASTGRWRDLGRKIEQECARARASYLPLLVADAPIVQFSHASSYDDALEAVRGWAENGHITRLAETTSVDRLGIPNYYATRPASLHKDTIISGGKGLTKQAAILSALFEAFERWAAERPLTSEVVATLDELVEVAAEVPVAAPYSIPRGKSIPWVVGIDLLTSKTCLLPLQRTIFPMPTTKPWVAGLGCDTTGLASGTHAVEAVCSAVLELIERDATSTMTLGTAKAVAPTSLPANAAKLVDRFVDAGVDLRISFLDSATGIPVFHAFSRDDHLRLSQFFCSGAGAHPSSEVALLRALTEVAQSRGGYITTLRDDVSEMAESLLRLGYEHRRAELVGWFTATDQTVALDACSGVVPRTTFLAQLDDLLGSIRAAASNPIVAWVPLQFKPRLHACRVYCPQLRNPSIELV